MKKRLLFIATLFALLSSCDQETMDIRGSLMETHNEGLKTEVQVLNDNAIHHITKPYTGDQQSLLFSSELSVDQLPQAGEIIVADTSQNTPYGLFSRVKEVRKSGENWEILLEEAALDEVFDKLEFDTVIAFTPDNIGEFFDENGNKLQTTITRGNTRVMTSKEDDAPKNSIEVSAANDQLNVAFNRTVPLFKGHGSMSYGVKCGYKNLKLRMSLTKKEKFYASIEPYVGLHGALTITTKNQNVKDEPIVFFLHRLPTIRLTPMGVPVIIRPHFKVYAQGILDAEAKFNTTFDLEGSLFMMMQYEEGWKHDVHFRSNISDTQLPFTVSSVELTGTAKVGLGIGLFGGLYAEQLGFGLNALLFAQDKASIKLDSEASQNLMLVNPSIAFSTGIDFNCNFKARVFSKDLIDEYVVNLPSKTFYSKDFYLFPQYLIFQTQKYKNGYGLRYDVDLFSLSTLLGGTYGYALFDENESLLEAHKAEGGIPISTMALRHENLLPGVTTDKKYLVSPMTNAFGMQFYGKKIALDTERKLRFCFRCASQTYDVLTFDFDFSKSSSNSIDVSYDANDYDGSGMRMHVIGTYNDNTKAFTGSVDFLFYNDPGQHRVDGFSLDLSSSDTGYAGCSKIVDNGGCAAAIRIYEVNTAPANKYQGIKIKNDNCGIGLYNPDYQ